ncbi:MAG: DUF4355 domain-containing protein [Firmicutes bacterium]|nr:DUF4355 domain-containing protein [Bacillota bacterium]
MTDFTPITTQEAFDAAISDRLKRERDKYEGYASPKDLEKIRGEYDKQISDLNKAMEDQAKKYAGFDKTIAEKDAKIKGYETASVKTRIAHELGLPYGAAEFLKGEDEDSIKESAEQVKKLFGSGQRTAPQANTEPPQGDSKTEAYRQVLRQLEKK